MSRKRCKNKKIKIKLHKGAKKRLRITGSGNPMHRKANKSHILTKKSSKRKQRLAGLSMVKLCDKRAVEQMLPGT